MDFFDGPDDDFNFWEGACRTPTSPHRGHLAPSAALADHAFPPLSSWTRLSGRSVVQQVRPRKSTSRTRTTSLTTKTMSGCAAVPPHVPRVAHGGTALCVCRALGLPLPADSRAPLLPPPSPSPPPPAPPSPFPPSPRAAPPDSRLHQRAAAARRCRCRRRRRHRRSHRRRCRRHRRHRCRHRRLRRVCRVPLVRRAYGCRQYGVPVWVCVICVRCVLRVCCIFESVGGHLRECSFFLSLPTRDAA